MKLRQRLNRHRVAGERASLLTSRWLPGLEEAATADAPSSAPAASGLAGATATVGLRRIVVATDGSPAARRAVIEAAELASIHDAELIAVHVRSASQYRARLGPVLPVARRVADPFESPGAA